VLLNTLVALLTLGSFSVSVWQGRGAQRSAKASEVSARISADTLRATAHARLSSGPAQPILGASGIRIPISNQGQVETKELIVNIKYTRQISPGEVAADQRSWKLPSPQAIAPGIDTYGIMLFLPKLSEADSSCVGREGIDLA
jgi:hypothetical protein